MNNKLHIVMFLGTVAVGLQYATGNVNVLTGIAGILCLIWIGMLTYEKVKS
ncbi:hypothetical protein KD909_15045 (plasmid) [Exiguobacterium sp. PFWT01]|uniref:hypothetical protein n=1 Tax=Exiguobacterium sp. PFWT01 TaxID=2829816 RepID=UPI001BAE0733|nr:hypothetical protein [Exiguobacterium sp. PFWT01]QUP88744.1 hypothetical protein KD909_15045 [Exiguobacterium sp. PFWT01]